MRYTSSFEDSSLLKHDAMSIGPRIEMEAASSYETSVTSHKSTRSHVPENFNLRQYRCENLISSIYIFISYKLDVQVFKESTKCKTG